MSPPLCYITTTKCGSTATCNSRSATPPPPGLLKRYMQLALCDTTHVVSESCYMEHVVDTVVSRFS
eukprot:193103-Rhodomonas_salina.2